MTGRRDIQGEMRNLLLDRDTADRLLTGRVEPDDAPPGYARVARLLRAASSLPPIDPAREHATVSAMVEGIRSHLLVVPPARQRRSLRRLVRAKIVAVAVGATLVGTTSLAFAGALPGAAQDVARTMLAKIGITVPGPNAHAGTHPDTRGSSTPASSPTAAASHPPDHSSTGAGHAQSGHPHGQPAGPHGQAQQHGQSGASHGQSGQSHGQSSAPHGTTNSNIRSERRTS